MLHLDCGETEVKVVSGLVLVAAVKWPPSCPTQRLERQTRAIFYYFDFVYPSDWLLSCPIDRFCSPTCALARHLPEQTKFELSRGEDTSCGPHNKIIARPSQ